MDFDFYGVSLETVVAVGGTLGIITQELERIYAEPSSDTSLLLVKMNELIDKLGSAHRQAVNHILELCNEVKEVRGAER